MYLGSELIDNLYEDKLIDSTTQQLIESIGQDGVFSIDVNAQGFYLMEECDQYFSKNITKEDLLLLSDFFKLLYENHDNLVTKFNENYL